MARISLDGGLTVTDIADLTPEQVSWLHGSQAGGALDPNIAAQVVATEPRAWIEEYADAHERSYGEVCAVVQAE